MHFHFHKLRNLRKLTHIHGKCNGNGRNCGNARVTRHAARTAHRTHDTLIYFCTTFAVACLNFHAIECKSFPIPAFHRSSAVFGRTFTSNAVMCPMWIVRECIHQIYKWQINSRFNWKLFNRSGCITLHSHVLVHSQCRPVLFHSPRIVSFQNRIATSVTIFSEQFRCVQSNHFVETELFTFNRVSDCLISTV